MSEQRVAGERLDALEREQRPEPAVEPVEIAGSGHGNDVLVLVEQAVVRRRLGEPGAKRRLVRRLARRVDRADLEADAARVELRPPPAGERPFLGAPVDELLQEVAVCVNDQISGTIWA
jgi:hypothetical protein